MPLQLSTNGVSNSNRMDFWHEATKKHIGAGEIIHKSRNSVEGQLESRSAGDLNLVHNKSTAFEFKRSYRDIRNDGHDDYYVGFVNEGSFRAEQNDQQYFFQPNSIILFDLSQPYYADMRTRYSSISFSIKRKVFEHLFGHTQNFSILDIGLESGSLPISAYITALYESAGQMPEDISRQMANVGVELIINAVAHRLSSEVKIRKSTGLLLHRAKQFISKNMSNNNLNVNLIAESLGISTRTLHILFNQIQSSPMTWVWQKRISLARSFLELPEHVHLSINEVSYRCGFSDQAHFSRRFKNQFGISPRDFRQRALLSRITPGNDANKI